MNAVRLRIGEERMELAVTYVGDLLEALRLPHDGRGIAIAVNDTVISKSHWTEYELKEGDRIEIVKAVQGG